MTLGRFRGRELPALRRDPLDDGIVQLVGVARGSRCELKQARDVVALLAHRADEQDPAAVSFAIAAYRGRGRLRRARPRRERVPLERGHAVRFERRERLDDLRFWRLILMNLPPGSGSGSPTRQSVPSPGASQSVQPITLWGPGPSGRRWW